MAQRCTYCGRTKKQHYDKDGKYRACVDVAGFKKALGLDKPKTGPQPQGDK